MHRRLVQLTMAAAALAVFLFGLPLAVAIWQYAEANELRDLERVAEATALSVAADLFQDEALTALPDQADDVELALYDREGALIAGDGPGGPGEHVQRAMLGEVSDGEAHEALVVAVPVTHDGEVIGVVRAATPQATVDRPVWLAWLGMAVLAAAAVGAAYILARRQAGTIARPLEELSTAARRLGDGDFSVRAPAAAIPEIHSVAASLNTTAKRLGDLIQRERAFSADASHQLRTPLAGLRLELEAALDRAQGDSRPLVSALAAVDRLEQTVNELLALARDTQRDRGERIDVQVLLDEITREWNSRADRAQRPLCVKVEADIPACAASAAAVRQVLAVLLDNAATHGRGEVSVKARDAGDIVAIDVSDEGPGVAVAEQDLFIRRTNTAAGHGIGLALARSLAEAEGGRLRLTNARPATFTLLLPAADSTLDEPLPSPHCGEGGIDQTDGSSRR
jgi:signal transduction histidine kinase